ncbi:hypothetical protein [Haloarchaeobius sp. HME9146]|uniref:hypothetical protein n=1 Tax=Haloarchaeobius sp. HME9146 TaxID=2978732 RepID=UPI0021C111D7|nr:hypothetical protein [Haloarchaeobius sp. HME9146]MCT9095289.1 hypothetical protein [Haloarchaeobius sp. HME9146]
MADKSNGSARRFNGILTSDDYEVLEEVAKRNHPSQKERAGIRRDARYRIRKRIFQAFVDLSYLNNTLPYKDRKLVFEEIFDEGPHILLEALSLIYHSNSEAGHVNGNEIEPHQRFEELLRGAIEYGELLEGRIPEVSVEIKKESESITPEELIDRVIQTGEIKAVESSFLHIVGERDTLFEKMIEREVTVSVVEDGETVEQIPPEEAAAVLSYKSRTEGKDSD